MRRINITIKIEDSDFIEDALRTKLLGLLGGSMTDYTLLPNTDYLHQTDSNFRRLYKAEKLAKRAKKDYIYKTKLNKK